MLFDLLQDTVPPEWIDVNKVDRKKEYFMKNHLEKQVLLN